MEAETELIALREFLPAASAPLTLIEPRADVPSVTLDSVLPGAAAELTRQKLEIAELHRQTARAANAGRG